MGWKMLFEDFQESCLVHAHRLYLSGMKEAFLCPFKPDLSNQVSNHEDIRFVGRCCCLKNIKIAT